MTEPPDRLAGQWTPAELGVHQAIGGGPLPTYVRRRTTSGCGRS